MKTITDLITSHLPRPTSVAIEADTELRAIGIDCVSLMGLAMDIEDHTGRRVTDKRIEEWATVADVAKDFGEACDG